MSTLKLSVACTGSVFCAIAKPQVNSPLRVGQRYPTVVHRFVVRNTIEQRVHDLRERKADVVSGTKKISKEDSLSLEDIRDLVSTSSSQSVNTQ